MAYTKEEEEKLNLYPEVSVEELAEMLKKPQRSIIAKLAKMGVYRKKERVTKTGEPIVSKLELLASIEEALGTEFPTLVKAGKEDLKKLAELL
jgi:hypothetical protein